MDANCPGWYPFRSLVFGNGARCTMDVVTVSGLKGGSGKTTVAVNVACALAAKGRKVLLLDCDPQGSATAWAAPGALSVKVVSMPIEDEREWIGKVRSAQADVVVVDTPPQIALTLTVPAALARLVLLPCAPSGLDLAALTQAAATLRGLKARGLDFVMAAVPTRVDSRTAASREIGEALKGQGLRIAPGLSSRIAFADAFNSGEWIGSYASGSPGHAEAMALARFVDKTLRRK